MPQLALALPENLAVGLLQKAEVLPRLGGRGDQVVHHAHQVLVAQAGRLDRVVGQVLGLLTRVLGTARLHRPTKAQARIGGLLAGECIERRKLRLRGRCSRDGRIAPLDREVVVGPNFRCELGDLILRLRDIVVTSVVHDRRRGAKLRRELGVTELLDRVGLAGAVVVAQAERVPDFVGHHVGQELAGKGVGERELLGTLVIGTGLDKVPVLGQLQDIVVEQRATIEDLTGPWVGEVRPHGVLHARRQPAHDRVANVLRVEVRILFLHGILAADHRILEPRFFKDLIPL